MKEPINTKEPSLEFLPVSRMVETIKLAISLLAISDMDEARHFHWVSEKAIPQYGADLSFP